MSSGDFNLLHLRNLKMYNPDGSYVSTGYVFTVSTQGTPSYTNSLSLSGVTASSITTSTLNSSAQIGFSTLVGSSLVATSATVSSATISTLTLTNQITISSLVTSSLVGGSAAVSSITVSTLNSSASMGFSTLVGSTLSANAASASSITVSTLNSSAQIGFSTLVGSSLVATAAAVSSITVSTLNSSAQIGFSTLVGSSLVGTVGEISQLATSSIVTSSLTSLVFNPLTISTNLLTTPDIQLMSTQISLGLSTNSTTINFSEGDYSASSWLTAKSGLTNVRKLGTSANGQYQLVVSGNTSDLWLSSDSGVTWSSLSPATTGLPVLTGAAYWSSGSISASGQYILLGIYGGSLWMSQDFGETFALTQQPTPDIWLQLNGNVNDSMGGPAATATGSPAYITVQHPGYSDQAVNLANTAGGTATRYVRGAWAGASNFTVSFWFNAQSLPGNVNQIIFSAYQTYLSCGVDSENSIFLNIPSGGGTNYYSIFASTKAVLNTWYYITFVYQTNGICSLYVNNRLENSTTNVQGVGSLTTSIFELSGYDTGQMGAFNGYVADLRILNSAPAYNPLPLLLPNIWLPFENNTQDLGSNAITPTVTGSVSYVPGVVGLNAVNIGNTVGGVPTNYIRSAVIADTDVTISLWFNIQRWFSGDYQTIFSTYSQGIFVGTDDTYTRFYVNIPTGSTTSVQPYYYSASLNTWYHVVVIFKINGVCSAYVNGAQIGSFTNSGGWGTLTYTGIYSLGCNDANVNKAFSGYIDDLRIYNAAIPFAPTTSTILPPPQNYRSVALSGTGQYALGSAASGWVVGSATTGQTWEKEAVCVGTQGDLIQPNKTGLAQAQWEQAGVNWFSSASSVFNATNNPAYGAFNNNFSNSSPYSWASSGPYTGGTGIYAGSVSTTISGIGPIVGEWLQIQSSIPAILQSYTFATGGTVAQVPKGYYIIGSNDGSTWFPIQQCQLTVNPFTTTFTGPSSNIIVNVSGIQTIQGNQTGSGTTTTYSTSNTPYLYFRIVINTVWVGGAIAEIGELYLNFARPSPTALALSYSGQYQLVATNSAAGNVMPNQTGLVSSTWVQGGVQWGATASTFLGTYDPYKVFNVAFTSGNIWASAGTPYNTLGVYTGTVSTTIQTVGAVLGEWIQLQTSVPLVLQSYTYASGGTHAQMPKVYYIIGSMDGSMWYPLQSTSVGTTPFTAGFQTCSTYLTMNTTGTQTIQGGQVGSATTTAYSYTTQPYMYFRMVIVSIYGGIGTVVTAEIAELYLNFQNSVSYSSNYGSTWSNSSRTLSNEIVALSPSGQYALSTNCVPPLARLTLDNTYFDTQGVLVSAQGAGTVTYSTSIKKVGLSSAFFNNTAGAVASVYLNYTVPAILNNPSALTQACWIYPTAYGGVNTVWFMGLSAPANNGSLLGFDPNGGIMHFTGDTSGVNTYTYSNVVVPLNTWTHVVMTFSGGLITIYVNGVSRNTSTIGGRLSLDSNGSYGSITNLYIGTSYPGTFRSFAGYVDDVRIYTQALSADEVSSLYNNPAITQSIGISNSYLPITSYSEPVLPNVSANVVDAKVSQTGQYMVAVTSAITNNVYYSIDFGATFNALTIGTSPMTACSISNDGSYLTVSNATTVYTLNKNSTGYTLAIGNQAGQQNQAQNAIAIGNQAGVLNQSANSIILNASGSALNSTAPGFYVAPIGNTIGLPMSLLGYGSDSQVVKSGVTVLPGTPSLGTPVMNLDVGGIMANPYIGRSNIYGGRHDADKRDSVWFGRLDGADGSTGGPFNNSEFLGMRCVVDTARNCGYGTSPAYDNQTYLGFWTWGNSFANSREVMRIRGDGNVGIGTTNPQASLHVNGGVNIQGYNILEFGWGIAGKDGNAGKMGYNIFSASLDIVGAGTTNTTRSVKLYDNLSVVGSLAKSSGTFDITHPMYPNSDKRLVHSFIEGPRCDLIYRGKTILLNGTANVNIDRECTQNEEGAMDYGTFHALCANPQFFLQNTNGFDRVRGSIQNGVLTITCENPTSSDMISWMVVAERKDVFIKQWDRTDADGFLVTQYETAPASAPAPSV